MYTYTEMGYCLVTSGFDYNLVFLEMSFLEVLYFFGIATKIEFRKMIAASMTITGSLAAIFQKKGEKTFIDTINEAIREISLNTGLIPMVFDTVRKKAERQSFDEISGVFKSWATVKKNKGLK